MKRGMSNAARHAVYRMDKLLEAIDKRDQNGKRDEDYHDRHITEVKEDGSRVWSY